MSAHQSLNAPDAEDAMASMQGGFDGAPSPRSHRQLLVWRVGRWLREQGAERPTSFYRAEEGALIVNGQILTVDAYGQIHSLSSKLRGATPTPYAQGCRP